MCLSLSSSSVSVMITCTSKWHNVYTCHAMKWRSVWLRIDWWATEICWRELRLVFNIAIYRRVTCFARDSSTYQVSWKKKCIWKKMHEWVYWNLNSRLNLGPIKENNMKYVKLALKRIFLLSLIGVFNEQKLKTHVPDRSTLESTTNEN